MTFVSIRIINYDSDTKYNIDVELDSAVDFGEELNAIDKVPVSVELSMGYAVTPWWNFFDNLKDLVQLNN